MGDWFRKKLSVVWLVGLAILGLLYDALIKPIISLNIESWATKQKLQDEILDGGQQSMPLLNSLGMWILESADSAMSALSSQWFFGFLVGAIIFGLWDSIPFLPKSKPKMTEHENKLSWATGIEYISIQHAACAFAGIEPSDLQGSARAQAILGEISAAVDQGWIATAKDFYKGKPHDRTLVLEWFNPNGPSYPEKKAAHDEIVGVDDLVSYFQGKNWDNSWIE